MRGYGRCFHVVSALFRAGRVGFGLGVYVVGKVIRSRWKVLFFFFFSFLFLLACG